MSQINSNTSPIKKGIFNGILISGAVIPSMLIILMITGFIDVSHIFGGTVTPDYEFVCFDQNHCYLKLEDRWYIVTDTIATGTIPPHLEP